MFSHLAALTTSLGEQHCSVLGPVHVIRTYVNRTGAFSRTGELSWAGLHKGRPVAKQRLSHWVVEAITLTYSSQGLEPPACLR